MTNDAGSPLAGAADFVLDLAAGPERSRRRDEDVYRVAGRGSRRSSRALRDDDEERSALRRVPALVQDAIDDAFRAVGALDHYADSPPPHQVGRGYNYATAMEIALKVRELTATVAEGFSSADLMHGPIAAVAPGTPAVIVAPPGKVLTSVLETTDALRARRAEPILIAEHPDAELPLPAGMPEWLSPLVAVVPGQVLALRRAVIGHHTIDAPPGLTKVTTTY